MRRAKADAKARRNRQAHHALATRCFVEALVELRQGDPDEARFCLRRARYLADSALHAPGPGVLR